MQCFYLTTEIGKREGCSLHCQGIFFIVCGTPLSGDLPQRHQQSFCTVDLNLFSPEFEPFCAVTLRTILVHENPKLDSEKRTLKL